MKTVSLKELVSLVQSGVKPVLVVDKPFYDQVELIYGVGMKTRVVGASFKDECYELTFDGTEFDEFNRSIAQPDWYNPETHKHDLKYFEHAEGYRLIDVWYFCEDDDLKEFHIEDGLSEPLYFLYQKDVQVGCKLTYVQWLEDKVMATLL